MKLYHSHVLSRLSLLGRTERGEYQTKSAKCNLIFENCDIWISHRQEIGE